MKKLIFFMFACFALASCTTVDEPIPEPTPTPDPTPKPDPIKFEAVDLGLSVKWASLNVNDNGTGFYGKKYAWGEYQTKKEYTESNSELFNKAISKNTNLPLANDAAYELLGESWGANDIAGDFRGVWRMPTREEMIELTTKCKWEKITRGSDECYKVTGPNGNSIILPITFYWSSTSAGEYYYAYGMNLKNYPGIDESKMSYRYSAGYIRPVLEPERKPEPVDLGLSVYWGDCNLFSTAITKGQEVAWGEVKPKDKYTESNYFRKDLSLTALQKSDIVNGSYNLNPKYDAATVNLGDGWRMPTKKEVEELLDLYHRYNPQNESCAASKTKRSVVGAFPKNEMVANRTI